MTVTRKVGRAGMAALLAAGLVISAPAGADMGGSSDAVEKATEAIEDGKYRRAQRHLEKHVQRNPGDADALNLLGYSMRKLELYESSENYYLRALEIEPEHLGANEYLGELYLETGRPELAKERLAVLEKACPGACEERNKLNKAIGDYSAKNGP